MRLRLLLLLSWLCWAACSTSVEKDLISEPEASQQDWVKSPTVQRSETPEHHYAIDWPVDQARLTQRFHLSGRRPHLGIDLAAPRGSKVLSAHYGTVIYTGNDFHGYGRLVIIEQNSSWATFYSHLDKIKVKEGQMIEQGQLVGLMGRSGNARGVHLHFELRNHRDPVDPLLFLPNGQSI
jgi:murein DD-endopeptidase MepM/ murein hydrolase activator NlpD